MKVVALIPIKMNNERLPGKNTKTFSDGKPLIECILQTVSGINQIDEVYVYCSDPAIKEYFPNEKVIFKKRDTTLDQSTTKINDVLVSFANDVEADIYVLAHATAPFIRGEHFVRAINAVKSGEYDSALSVTILREFIWKDGRPFNYALSDVPRTQDLEPMYVETCGMYVYTANLIKQERRRVGDTPYLVEVSKQEACDINDSEDFLIADAIYTCLYSKKEEAQKELGGKTHLTFKVLYTMFLFQLMKGGAVA